ncbi:MAG: GTP cyclohydrolase I [Lewinellaceae bacterium]|nr:GTP cyclohydrolase I [candidate division KSB1 bacterium]MCB9294679.1 GTP cyclohydrolase I [Lewinellaceae bacterium]
MDKEKPDCQILNWLELVVPEDELLRLSKAINKKPVRITKAYKEVFNGYNIKDASEILTVTETIPENDYSGLISAFDVPFMSFCEHHFLPFIGKVDLIYEPTDKILGIGKLSRLIDFRTQRFNIQENIARQLCEDLMQYGNAKGAFAKVTANHMCACYRGPKKYNAGNNVIYALGTFNAPENQSKIHSILNRK